MSNLALVEQTVMPLPALIDRAANALMGAKSAAEVLEARDMASLAADVASKTARIAKAKRAHDEVVTAAYRAKADALEIEAQANRRIADEYDAAQKRGEVQKHGSQGRRDISNRNIPSVTEVGLTSKDVMVAREIRDAEQTQPGIVRQALDNVLNSGKEPTRADIKRAVAKPKRARGARFSTNTDNETQHDRDLRMLMGVWDATCETAREEFLKIITNK